MVLLVMDAMVVAQVIPKSFLLILPWVLSFGPCQTWPRFVYLSYAPCSRLVPFPPGSLLFPVVSPCRASSSHCCPLSLDVFDHIFVLLHLRSKSTASIYF